MSKVLVTGSDGQLGRELQELPNTDDWVFLTRKELDITNLTATSRLLDDGSFDFLVNCAAYTAVDKAEEESKKCYNINVEAVKNLTDQCLKNDVTLIHISSDYVYHPQHNFPIDELESCVPQGIYAKTKLEGEEYIQASLSKFYILRTSWVYSSFGHNFVKTMLRLSKTKTELGIVDDQIGSPTYAADLASAIATILTKGGKPGVYNYSNLGYISWAEFAREIFRLSENNVVVKQIPTSDYPTPAPRPLNSRLIKSRIVDEFAIELQYWKKSLIRCLDKL